MLSDSNLTVRFTLLGREETRFTSWSIDSAYLVSTDGFSFDFLPSRPEDGRFLELQPVHLSVGGVPQLVGRVDRTRVGHNGSIVSVEGRDYIADMVECNIDPNVKVGANTELDDALLEAMGPVAVLSITDFENILFSEARAGKHIKRKKRKRRRRKLQDYKSKPGEGIYEFCNRLVARHGATIQPTLDRNQVVLDAPDYTQTPLYTLTRTDDPTRSNANTIVTGEADRDYSSFPTYAIFTGVVGAPGAPTAGMTKVFKMVELAKAFNSEMGEILSRAIEPERPELITDVTGLLYRLLYHRDQEARTPEDLELGAKRAIAERLKNTLCYRCTVKGHADPRTGAIYTINTMANVNDAITGVNEPLWISKRTLRYRDGEGAFTDMELWRPESFQIADDER